MSVCCVGVKVCDFFECVCVCVCVWRGGEGGISTAATSSDSTFRSVQTMRLTQRCSPQPQCKIDFLKPVPWLYETPAQYRCSLKPDDAKSLTARCISVHSHAYNFLRDERFLGTMLIYITQREMRTLCAEEK